MKTKRITVAVLNKTDLQEQKKGERGINENK